MSCYSTYTFPPFAEVTEGIFVGWLGARSDPRWGAVVSIVSPKTMLHEQNSYRCARGEYTGVLPDTTPFHLVDHDDRTPGITAHFDAAFDFADKHAANGPLYWHCQAGISRSPFTVATYLAARRGWVYEDALRRVKEVRGVVDIWPAFLSEGRKYLRYVEEVKTGRLLRGEYLAPARSGW